MNKTALIIVWNVLLSAVLGYALFRKAPAAVDATSASTAQAGDTSVVMPVKMTTDTAALKNAHIAFFFMDSIRSQYALVKESADRVRSEGHRLEDNLARSFSLVGVVGLATAAATLLLVMHLTSPGTHRGYRLDTYTP